MVYGRVCQRLRSWNRHLAVPYSIAFIGVISKGICSSRASVQNFGVWGLGFVGQSLGLRAVLALANHKK